MIKFILVVLVLLFVIVFALLNFKIKFMPAWLSIVLIVATIILLSLTIRSYLVTDNWKDYSDNHYTVMPDSNEYNPNRPINREDADSDVADYLSKYKEEIEATDISYNDLLSAKGWIYTPADDSWYTVYYIVEDEEPYYVEVTKYSLVITQSIYNEDSDGYTTVIILSIGDNNEEN